MLSILILFPIISFATKLELNKLWDDDFNYDSNAIDGWSSDVMIDSNLYAPDRYHGFWTDIDYTYLYRYFTIPTYCTFTLNFTFIWGCDPEPYHQAQGDHAYIQCSYIPNIYDINEMIWWEDSTTEVYEIYDTTISDMCTDPAAAGQDHGWGLDKSLSTILTAHDNYLINFTSYQTVGGWNEYWGLFDININIDELCDITSFLEDITATDFAQYTTAMDPFIDYVNNDIEDVTCKESVSDQILNDIDRYLTDTATIDDICDTVNKEWITTNVNTLIANLATEGTNYQQTMDAVLVQCDDIPPTPVPTPMPTKVFNPKDFVSPDDDDKCFNFVPLTPEDLMNTETPLTDEEIELIADSFDQLLNDLFTTHYNTDNQDEDGFCNDLNTIYEQIAGFQKEILVGITPGTDSTSHIIEKDYFCSYTDRILTSSNDDDDPYEAIIKNDYSIKLPYALINKGRKTWKDYDESWDSIDLTVMCVDNILFNDCKGDNDNAKNKDELSIIGDFGLSINIDVDNDEDKSPFQFSLPIGDQNSDDVYCGWIENVDDDWGGSGCNVESIVDKSVTCSCDHQTVFNLIEDLRSDELSGNAANAKALQDDNVYLAFMIIYGLLAGFVTYLIVTLYMMN